MIETANCRAQRSTESLVTVFHAKGEKSKS